MPNFNRLVRFKDTDGNIRYGEAPSSGSLIGSEVDVYSGIEPWNLSLTKERAVISEVLAPLNYTPIIYGIGLNYKTHIAEAGWPTPPYPTVFTKPSGALNGPFSIVSINPQCTLMDYEGERSGVRIGGYTAANDVSSRYWQAPDISGQQHGYAKSFDGFAPIGPVLVSKTAAGLVGDVVLVTRVNDQERQRAKLDDLLFGVGDLIVHLSRGTTLKAGTIILTGTPGGVAAFMKPPAWLKTGDTVEVEISGIGSILNEYVYE
uniref:Fumarylacetoacetase-like C-terminal domain-containing protein n=1 Tax=Bionectria ochroleuca TaxID=29856 RepID=A0A8H7K4A5_BIOOC